MSSYYPDVNKRMMAFEANISKSSDVFVVDPPHPLRLKSCQDLDFQLYTLAPVVTNGWALLGELEKWVSVSNDRFSNFAFDSESISVQVRGEEGETVHVSFFSPQQQLVTSSCQLPMSGTALVGATSSGGFCKEL